MALRGHCRADAPEARRRCRTVRSADRRFVGLSRDNLFSSVHLHAGPSRQGRCGLIQNIAGTSTATATAAAPCPRSCAPVRSVAASAGPWRPRRRLPSRAPRDARRRAAHPRAQCRRSKSLSSCSSLVSAISSFLRVLLSALCLCCPVSCSSGRSVLHRSMSICRARLRRDRTVPTGQPAMAAASSYESPFSSQSTTTSR